MSRQYRGHSQQQRRGRSTQNARQTPEESNSPPSQQFNGGNYTPNQQQQQQEMYNQLSMQMGFLMSPMTAMFAQGQTAPVPFGWPNFFPAASFQPNAFPQQQAWMSPQPMAAMNGLYGDMQGNVNPFFNNQFGGPGFSNSQSFVQEDPDSQRPSHNSGYPVPSVFAPTASLQSPQRSCTRSRSPHSPPRSATGHTAPSAASGGVPDPTAAYLLQASLPEQPSPGPRPLLVVIDLNGTLLYRPNKKNPHNFVSRPHAKDFLTYCIQTFHVVIWSSARMENVSAMIDKLLADEPDLRSQIVAVWGRDKFGLSRQDYQAKTQCYKRLTLLWADPAIAASQPQDSVANLTRRGAKNSVRSLWDQSNTVLVDDSIEKARSEPHNAITIPDFRGTDPQTQAPVLPLVHDYLNKLSCQMDVSRYIRAHPFNVDEASLATNLSSPGSAPRP